MFQVLLQSVFTEVSGFTSVFVHMFQVLLQSVFTDVSGFTSVCVHMFQVLLQSVFTEVSGFTSVCVHRGFRFYFSLCSQRFQVLLQSVFIKALSLYFSLCSQRFQVLLQSVFTDVFSVCFSLCSQRFSVCNSVCVHRGLQSVIQSVFTEGLVCISLYTHKHLASESEVQRICCSKYDTVPVTVTAGEWPETRDLPAVTEGGGGGGGGINKGHVTFQWCEDKVT